MAKGGHDFGKWEGFHNMAFRGENIIIATDELNAPIDNVFCETMRMTGGRGQDKRGYLGQI